MKRRLDHYLVETGLADSRHKAQALILAGQVLVNDRPAEKPGLLIAPDARVRLRGEPLRYVGRGGLKLEAALRGFALDVRDALCLDIGASTGGFTDCLLQHGARQVYALDVGHNQLDWKLRSDSRVVVREGVNARYLMPADFPERFTVIVADVSFISLRLILPALGPLAAPEAALVALVKPQFEVGREQVGKGGIVRDRRLHATAMAGVLTAARQAGFAPERMLASPVLGAEGNQEYLLLARYGRPSVHVGGWQADWKTLFPDVKIEAGFENLLPTR
ncbi:TlyA family RNA methyltransferase [Chloracidobacterium thermophilum]|uniref:TlyA family RNA methyltransferase n=1 Tax=Chloracidobacterium thermophilum TaxID=458033 RepID=UPI0007388252|nr:TlyA family RNA methyltransferase [Chloracidobacterium thermophilum]